MIAGVIDQKFIVPSVVDNGNGSDGVIILYMISLSDDI